jgi:hypothetical protein
VAPADTAAAGRRPRVIEAETLRQAVAAGLVVAATPAATAP